MDSVYLAIKKVGHCKSSQNCSNAVLVWSSDATLQFESDGNNHRFITDDIELAKAIADGWICYQLKGLKRITAVETTVIEAD